MGVERTKRHRYRPPGRRGQHPGRTQACWVARSRRTAGSACSSAPPPWVHPGIPAPVCGIACTHAPSVSVNDTRPAPRVRLLLLLPAACHPSNCAAPGSANSPTTHDTKHDLDGQVLSHVMRVVVGPIDDNGVCARDAHRTRAARRRARTPVRTHEARARLQ